MRVVITAQELLDKDIWDRLCDIRGWTVYAINEGLIHGDEEIHLSEEEVKKLGITITKELG